MTNNNLKISIVTVVYNNKKGLEQTIESVLSQKFKDFEYIVVDGGSIDGTLDIIKKYEKYIDRWVSEKDTGIYDAMNKGAKISEGGYLYFLNSGDYLFDENVLDRIAKHIKQNNSNLIVGKIIRLHNGLEDLFSRVEMRRLKFGVTLPHQGSFIKNSVFKKINGYDTHYKIAGDFDFFCRFYKKGFSYKVIEEIVAYMPSGGASSNKKITLPESYKIIVNYFGYPYALLFYLKVVFKTSFEQGFKKILLFLGLRKVYEKLLKIKMKGFN